MPEHASKKHGHETSASEEMIQALEWVTRNRKPILLVVAALLLGGALFALMQSYQRRADEEAWKAFYTVEVRHRRNEDPTAEAVALGEAAQETRSPAAFYALVRQIAEQGVTYKKDDMAAAVEAGRTFLSRFPRHPLAQQVRLDMGTLLFNLGEYAEARTHFETVIASPASYLHEDARFYLAQTHAREGNTAEAGRIYSQMSRWQDVATSPQTRDLAIFANLLLQEGTAQDRPASGDSAAESLFPIRVPTLEDLGRLTDVVERTDLDIETPEEAPADVDAPVIDLDIVPAEDADAVPGAGDDIEADTDAETATEDADEDTSNDAEDEDAVDEDASEA